MKLSNIFKKSAKNATKSNVQKIDKKQLEKVIGGTDGTVRGFDPIVLDRAVSTPGVK